MICPKSEVPDEEDGIATSLRPSLEKFKRLGTATTNFSCNDKTAEQVNNVKVKIENEERENTDELLSNCARECCFENRETINESAKNEVSAGTREQLPNLIPDILSVNGKSINESCADSIVKEKSQVHEESGEKSNENNTFNVETTPTIKQEPQLILQNNIRLENKDAEQEEGEITDTDEEMITNITLEKDPQTSASTSPTLIRVKSEYSTNFSSLSTLYPTLPPPPLPISAPPPLPLSPPPPPPLPPSPPEGLTNITDTAMNHISDDFFNDLLVNTDQVYVTIKTENNRGNANDNHDIGENNGDGYANGTNVIESCQRIPKHFFDELLLPNHDKEVKYSEYLQKLQNELTYAEDETAKPRQTHKTSQKRNYDDSNNDNDNNNAYDARKRHCAFEGQGETELNPFNSTSSTYKLSQNNVKGQPGVESHTSRGVNRSQSLAFKPIKLVKQEIHISSSDPLPATKSDITEGKNIVPLTSKETAERAIQRVLETLKIFKKYPNNQTASPLHENGFLFTRTMRKLSFNGSCLDQKSCENRSLLHNKSNVNYKFNSLAWTSNNLCNNDLEVLSPTTTRLARLLCYDAYALKDKMMEIKLPAKLQQIRNRMEEQQQLEHKRLENSSTFFNSTTTQTEDEDFKIVDANVVLDDRSHANVETVDIAIQVRPKVGNIAVQTTSPEHNMDLDDLPIIQLIRKLNDNQLMALHDFAELISESPQTSNAMDMYRLRQRMLDIYKDSQIPSVMQHQAQYADLHRVNHLSNDDHNHNYQRIHHTSLSERDPRYLSLRNNHVNRSDNRSPSPKPSISLLSSHPSTVGPKFYGRGGKRR